MSGDTLRRAATYGQSEWLKRLFASGANPCECDEVGLTPLHFAALNGHVEAVETCAINDRGTDPEGNRAWALQQQSSCGWSALHVAAWEGKNAAEIVRILLGLGCDPWLLDDRGRTAADLAELKFEETGSATSELVARVLRTSLPGEATVRDLRAKCKARHWVQQVRRGNTAAIGDYPTEKEDRAPTVPTELKVAEKFHVPFAADALQAIRGAYGVQALRNLVEACVEAEANAARRFELAHSRQLGAETVGKVDLATPPHQRVAATAIDFERHANPARHLRGDGTSKLHPGYSPFKNAGQSHPGSEGQRAVQQSRKDPFPPMYKYPVRPFSKVLEKLTTPLTDRVKSYPLMKWKEIEFGPELFGEGKSKEQMERGAKKAAEAEAAGAGAVGAEATREV